MIFDVFTTYSLIRREHLFLKLTLIESIIVCFFMFFSLTGFQISVLSLFFPQEIKFKKAMTKSDGHD